MLQLTKDDTTQRLLVSGELVDSSEWDSMQGEIDREQPLDIVINSEGGNLQMALGMFAYFKDEFKGDLSVYVRGMAASAVTLFLCIPKAKVTISDHSFVFLHFPSVQMFDPQKASDLQKTLQQLEAYGDAIIDIYAHRTGLTKDYIKRILSEERLLNAKEAVDLGLCDNVETETVKISACLPSNLKLHLTKFAKLITKDEFKAANPEIYAEIYQDGKTEGVDEERKRIQSLDDLEFEKEFAYNAKYQSCVTATQAALDYVKRLKTIDKDKKQQYLNGVRADSAEFQTSLNPLSAPLDGENIYQNAVFKGFKLF